MKRGFYSYHRIILTLEGRKDLSKSGRYIERAQTVYFLPGTWAGVQGLFLLVGPYIKQHPFSWQGTCPGDQIWTWGFQKNRYSVALYNLKKKNDIPALYGWQHPTYIMEITLATMWSQLPFSLWGFKITTSISQELREKLRHAEHSQIPPASYFQSKSPSRNCFYPTDGTFTPHLHTHTLCSDCPGVSSSSLRSNLLAITPSAVDWTVSPTNPCVETGTPNVMALGGGSFGRWLGLDEVMGWGSPR